VGVSEGSPSHKLQNKAYCAENDVSNRREADDDSSVTNGQNSGIKMGGHERSKC
jgi:hypothetical protein